MNTPKILIVGHEAFTRDHLRHVLTGFGYQVTGVARSSQGALTCVRQCPPDLLVTDLRRNGDIDAMEIAFRARDEWKIPAILLARDNDPQMFALTAGMSVPAYLVQSVCEEDLRAAVELALRETPLRVNHEGLASSASKLMRAQDELRTIAERLFKMQDQECSDIARDLHDDIGQRIALLQIGLETLWEKIPPKVRRQNEPEFQEVLSRMIDLSKGIRSISHRLHPSVLDDLGLATALRQLTQEFHEHYRMPAYFSARNVPERLGPKDCRRFTASHKKRCATSANMHDGQR